MHRIPILMLGIIMIIIIEDACGESPPPPRKPLTVHTSVRAFYQEICFCAPEGRIAPIGASNRRRVVLSRNDDLIPNPTSNFELVVLPRSHDLIPKAMLHDDVDDALSVRHWRVALSSACGFEVGIGGGWSEEEGGWNRSEEGKGGNLRKG